MRVASICDTCATIINASCIIYNGNYLSVIDTSPLDSLDMILSNINDAYESQSGDGAPTTQIPLYIGQYYIDTTNDEVWIGLSTSGINWGLFGSYTTTTTTSTTTTTTTTAP